MADEVIENSQPIVEPVVEAVVEVPAPVVEEVKPKAKKQKTVKEEPAVVDSDSIEAKYLVLKEAARNLIRQYSKNHIVRGPEDLRFPGLKELAAALKD